MIEGEGGGGEEEEEEELSVRYFRGFVNFNGKLRGIVYCVI